MEENRIRIKDLSEKKETEIWLLLGNFEEKLTAAGKPYIVAEMSDRKPDGGGHPQKIKVKFWDYNFEQFSTRFEKGKIMALKVKAQTYNGTITYTAGRNEVGTVSTDSYVITDFIDGPDVSIEEIKNEVYSYADELSEKRPELSGILNSLLSKYGEQFFSHAGAKSLHHSYESGLAYHSYRMFRLSGCCRFINKKFSMNSYERLYELACEKGMGDLFGLSFIAEHCYKEISEEQMDELHSEIDNNRFLRACSLKHALSKNQEGHLYRAMYLCRSVTEFYKFTDPQLIFAVIVLLITLVNDKNDIKEENCYFSKNRLNGRRMNLVLSTMKEINPSVDLTDEDKLLLEHCLMASDIGSIPSLIKPAVPEAFLAGIVFSISAYTFVDTDLVRVGALIHDIGKILELEKGPNPEYTVEGTLKGHIFLGHKILNTLDVDNQELDEQAVSLLSHFILSHHGNSEMGAFVEPAFPEAHIVHLLDMLDSRMTVYEEMIEKTEKGMISDYNKMIGRVYSKMNIEE